MYNIDRYRVNLFQNQEIDPPSRKEFEEAVDQAEEILRRRGKFSLVGLSVQRSFLLFS